MSRFGGGQQVPLWLCSAAAALALVGAAAAQTTVVVGTDPSKVVIKGRLVTPDQVLDGELVIDGSDLTCVAASCPHPVGATLVTVGNAYVFPGFIDAHNHVAYNILPHWAPPRLYQNRGQWQRAQAYADFKKPYAELKDQKGLVCEMVKYGEIKALLSGVTTIQGTSPNRACFRTLIRNAENQNELGTPAGLIRTFILDIGSFQGAIDPTVTKAFVVHLAEGVDAKSLQEFQTLKQKGLLTKATAIIHGTAFGAAQFGEMAAVGAKLIWSPQSNLALYGKTTRIDLALQQGVVVSLGVDWNPTGSATLFDELRVAAQVNDDDFGGAIPTSDWIKLITVNPAATLALDAYIGRLATGHKADVTVVKEKDADPNRSLLGSHLQDVQMVWLGGELLYANEAILQKVKPNQCERLVVHGSPKRLCVKDAKDPVTKSSQTLAEIQAVLEANYAQLAPLVP